MSRLTKARKKLHDDFNKKWSGKAPTAEMYADMAKLRSASSMLGKVSRSMKNAGKIKTKSGSKMRGALKTLLGSKKFSKKSGKRILRTVIRNGKRINIVAKHSSGRGAGVRYTKSGKRILRTVIRNGKRVNIVAKTKASDKAKVKSFKRPAATKASLPTKAVKAVFSEDREQFSESGVKPPPMYDLEFAGPGSILIDKPGFGVTTTLPNGESRGNYNPGGAIKGDVQEFLMKDGSIGIFDKNGFKEWKETSKPKTFMKNGIRQVRYTPKTVVQEAKKFGIAYIKKKYGEGVYNRMKSSLKGIKDFVKSQDTGYGLKGLRNPGTASFNAPKDSKAGWEARSGRMLDGGPADPAYANANSNAAFKRQQNFNLDNDEDLAQGSQHEWAQPTSISHLISGQLRQAAHAPVDAWEQWAQDKTGIATLSNRSTPFGVDMNYQEDNDADFMQTPGVQLSQANPMGAFGTSTIMEDYGNQYSEAYAEEATGYMTFAGWAVGDDRHVGFKDPAEYEAWRKSGDPGLNTLWTNYNKAVDENLKATYTKMGIPLKYLSGEYDIPAKYQSKVEMADKIAYGKANVDVWNPGVKSAYTEWFNSNQKQGGKLMTYDPKSGDLNYGGTTGWKEYTPPKPDPSLPQPEGYKPPMYDGAPGTGADNPMGPITGDQGIYNPWGRMEGATNNAYGPNQNTIAQGSMQAMALANAYFAPQRAELAYELGDMETDMRRMAVNLGRQVDDPVLQAKLYKEASRAVRTLDIQQNTFAFQMADARRKEDLANWQFYDQLAQNEAQLKLQNYQFLKNLELQQRYYNLQNYAAQTQGQMNSNIPAPGGNAQESEDSYGNLLNPYGR